MIWTAPGLTDGDLRCLSAIGSIDWDGPEWSTEAKRDYERLLADPGWYRRRKAEWAEIVKGGAT